MEHDVAGKLFRTLVAEARELKLTSDEINCSQYAIPARRPAHCAQQPLDLPPSWAVNSTGRFRRAFDNA